MTIAGIHNHLQRIIFFSTQKRVLLDVFVYVYLSNIKLSLALTINTKVYRKLPQLQSENSVQLTPVLTNENTGIIIKIYILSHLIP